MGLLKVKMRPVYGSVKPNRQQQQQQKKRGGGGLFLFFAVFHFFLYGVYHAWVCHHFSVIPHKAMVRVMVLRLIAAFFFFFFY